MSDLESRLRRAAETLDDAAERWEPASSASSDGAVDSKRSRRWLVTAGAAATIVAGLAIIAVLAGEEDVPAPAGPSSAATGDAASTSPATPAIAVPGVPQPFVGDELTAALRDLGVVVESAPRAATRLHGALFCGVSTMTRPAVSTLQPSRPAQCFASGQKGPDPWVFVLEVIDRDRKAVTVWRSMPGEGVRSFTRIGDEVEWSTLECERVVYRRETESRTPQFGCDEDGQPYTTTTVPAEPTQLEFALGALGVDVDAAPQGATLLDGEFCGVDRWASDQSESETTAQRCLIQRYEAGERAIAVTEWFTPEASPVITIYRTNADGVVDVYMDSTRDAVFGSGGWGVSICDGVTYSERDGLKVQGCRAES